jgi:hypothetical protein
VVAVVAVAEVLPLVVPVSPELLEQVVLAVVAEAVELPLAVFVPLEPLEPLVAAEAVVAELLLVAPLELE